MGGPCNKTRGFGVETLQSSSLEICQIANVNPGPLVSVSDSFFSLTVQSMCFIWSEPAPNRSSQVHVLHWQQDASPEKIERKQETYCNLYLYFIIIIICLDSIVLFSVADYVRFKFQKLCNISGRHWGCRNFIYTKVNCNAIIIGNVQHKGFLFTEKPYDKRYMCNKKQ